MQACGNGHSLVKSKLIMLLYVVHLRLLPALEDRFTCSSDHSHTLLCRYSETLTYIAADARPIKAWKTPDVYKGEKGMSAFTDGIFSIIWSPHDFLLKVFVHEKVSRWREHHTSQFKNRTKNRTTDFLQYLGWWPDKDFLLDKFLILKYTVK